MARQFIILFLLAIFTANAANKFFIEDLDYERDHQFYEKIFEGKGEAPDQYRILPLLGIKWLRAGLELIRPHVPFNHAVLIYNVICSFLLYFLLLRLLIPIWEEKRIFTFLVLFSGAYIYTQYTGWRPDTLGLLLIATAFVFGILQFKKPLSSSFGVVDLFAVFGILFLAFSRSDIALLYGVFLAYYHFRCWLTRILLLALPLATQYFLQFYLYKDAAYYTHAFMLWDNLGGYYLARNPGTWLIAAVIIIYWSSIRSYLQQTWRAYWLFYGLLLGYLFLILVVGRLNEYRLYLPFLPLLVYLWRAEKDYL